MRILYYGREIALQDWRCHSCDNTLDPQVRNHHIKNRNSLFLNCPNPECGEEYEVKLEPDSPFRMGLEEALSITGITREDYQNDAEANKVIQQLGIGISPYVLLKELLGTIAQQRFLMEQPYGREPVCFGSYNLDLGF